MRWRSVRRGMRRLGDGRSADRVAARTRSSIISRTERVGSQPVASRSRALSPTRPVRRRRGRALDRARAAPSLRSRSSTWTASSFTDTPTAARHVVHLAGDVRARPTPCTRATTSSTCRKSRTEVAFPIASARVAIAPSRASASARRTSAGSRKLAACPGPLWLKTARGDHPHPLAPERLQRDHSPAPPWSPRTP